ncbi:MULTISPECIES: prolyl oligopeptidase family protein [unclassified Shewanella]|uniref:prolyl oligopeptidase family serine peptidase n=1 Tax=unclassified Shewanella TaxID=196818 RepID=UPI001BC347EB|nr:MULTISPECIES: prolyl oligopeptidase family serine peptidase [unclassified Shewanella]GIU20129.1 prolyl endopeptidase [Shewanella sp. MBTL60-112-B1]GIU38536.1 prolyl endopeptidase [Shewanella sp. MBTL60-112-B2]
MRIHSVLTKKHLLAIGLGIAVVGCQSQPSQDNTTNTIAASQDSVIETIHGVQVADPYRYLEVESDKTKKWVAEQQQAGHEYLANIENKQAIVDRITELWNFEKISAPFEKGTNTFYYRNDGLQAQSVLYVTGADGQSKIALDPNSFSDDGTVALSGVSVSDDGKTLAYGVSKSGSDWQAWHFIDVATGTKLTDELDWIKFSSAVWNSDNSGVYYARYDAPEGGNALADVNFNQKVYFHKIGTSQSEDALVYERPQNKDWGFGIEVSENGDYLLLYISQGTDSRNRFFYKSLKDPKAEVVELIAKLEAEYQFIGNDDSVFYFKTDYNAPNGKVIAVDVNNSAKDNWKTIIPELKDPISSIKIVNDHFVVSYLHDVLGKLTVYNMNGDKRQDVTLPGKGKIAGPYGKRSKDYFYYVFNSYTQPQTTYKFDFKTGESSVYSKPEVSFDPSDYISEQVFYTSKDGTKVPMMLSYKKGMKKDGQNPTLLYAYGGFAISLTPRFSPANIAWMDMGGVYAVPNLRGGAEYGESWHQAGMFDKKQNVFDDYYAAAEYLIDEDYTNSSKLGAYGRSNGGLLMGAALTQRPELFAAVLPAVGVLDMLRFQKFTIGWAWTSEYGSADNAEQFPALYAYSPYHNLKAQAYPATMVMTADHDDRVVPLHSFKFGALMQEKQQGDAPVIMRIESKAGHGAGKPTSMKIDEFADIYSFLWHNFGLQVPAKIAK